MKMKQSKFFYVTLTAIVLFGLGLLIQFTMPQIHGLGVAGVCLLMLYIMLTAVGCSRVGWDYFIVSMNELPAQQNSSSKRIALTFDDGPTFNSANILDILKQHNVPATFFLVGQRVEQQPELARRMLAEGHSIGNHTQAHGHLINFKETKGMMDEITACNQAIEQHMGIQTTLFRAPHGVLTLHLSRAIHRLGMRSIGWNLRSFDTSAKDADLLLHRITSKLQNRAIILLHDDCDITAQILPKIIEHARAQGYEFDVIR